MPWQHAVSVRVHATVELVAPLFPPGLVTVEEPPAEQGWVRVRMRAERLDWVPALLAALPVPFVVEGPDALRELVRDLGERLTAAAGPGRRGSPPWPPDSRLAQGAR